MLKNVALVLVLTVVPTPTTTAVAVSTLDVDAVASKVAAAVPGVRPISRRTQDAAAFSNSGAENQAMAFQKDVAKLQQSESLTTAKAHASLYI